MPQASHVVNWAAYHEGVPRNAWVRGWQCAPPNLSGWRGYPKENYSNTDVKCKDFSLRRRNRAFVINKQSKRRYYSRLRNYNTIFNYPTEIGERMLQYQVQLPFFPLLHYLHQSFVLYYLVDSCWYFFRLMRRNEWAFPSQLIRSASKCNTESWNMLPTPVITAI